MATLTSNISNVSLTVSGNTQKSATISWSLPSVPSGATITSCTLTGTATASMSKGNATITVNGQTVSSGSNFTINLGTGNTTNSVTATAKGGNKNAAGTVTFSNLVYTVNYSVPLPKYTVTFVDWNGTVLKTQEVEESSFATAPTNPTRTGYTFTGWDKSFNNITSDLTVTAQYTINKYTVTFVDWDGTILKTQEVEHGSSATAPSNPGRDGYSFIGWDTDFTNITSNLIVTVQYIEKPEDELKVKESGVWTKINKVYKKISGIWVEQANIDLVNLFDSSMEYVKKIFTPTAILYSDGTFVFQNDNVVDSSHGDVVSIYTDWDTINYSSSLDIPWSDKRADITNIILNTAANPISLYMLFYNLSNLSSIDIYNFNTSNVTNMVMMFRSCSSLTSLDLSSFDTSNVTTINSMFSECSSLISLDLSGFDTSNVTGMNALFSNCSNLTSLDLSNFNTSKVTDIGYMFSNCSNLTSLDLSNFNTSNVTDMQHMFDSCSSLTSLDLSNFNTSNVTTALMMFYNCSNLTSLDLSNFNTSKVTNMGYMFSNCSNLTSLDLSNFNTSNVTNMGSMFSNCSNLTSLDLSSFDMSKVSKTSYMFSDCTNLQTIYVKDETAKTKIEASTNFPTTATVIIGSPA